MPYVIAISNEKGGVAKTTTTFSLGASIAEAGKDVLLVDLDPQGNLTLANSIEPGEAKLNSGEILLDKLDALACIRKTGTPKMDIIPSSPRLADAEQFLPVRTNY